MDLNKVTKLKKYRT